MLGLPARPSLRPARRIHALGHGLGQSGEGQTRRARQGQVRGEPAYGIAGEEGIDAEVNDLRLGPGPPEIGEPRHVRLHDEDDVGFLQVRRGIEAGVQGMVLGEIDVGIGLLEDWRAERLRQGHEGGNGARVAPGRLDDDERVAGGGEELRGLCHHLGGGDDRARRHRAGGVGILEGLVSLGQHLARQGQVHGALRLRLGQREGAIHHGLQLGEAAQLVVPLHVLADHACLVEGLLGPVNVTVTAARQAVLRDGIASRAEEHGHVASRGVDDAADGVAGTHDDVDHDRLRPSRDHCVAVGHGHGRGLVRDGQRPRARLPLRAPLGVRLDEGREVRARVGEEILDASRGQQLEVGLRGALHCCSLHHSWPPWSGTL